MVIGEKTYVVIDGYAAACSEYVTIDVVADSITVRFPVDAVIFSGMESTRIVDSFVGPRDPLPVQLYRGHRVMSAECIVEKDASGYVLRGKPLSGWSAR